MQICIRNHWKADTSYVVCPISNNSHIFRVLLILMTFPSLKMLFHQWNGHMEKQIVSANFVANTRGWSQSCHVAWPRVELIQASNKRDADQKKQTWQRTENLNRSKTFATVCVVSFIYVCAHENLALSHNIISMFGFAFIGVKKSK